MATLTQTTNSAVVQQQCGDIFLYSTVALHQAGAGGGQFCSVLGVRKGW